MSRKGTQGFIGQMTTAKKTALPVEYLRNGNTVYDTTLNKFQIREAGAWTSAI